MVESEAQGRLPGIAPVSVVDIGSNSIRLVIYEGMNRSPAILFNEKVKQFEKRSGGYTRIYKLGPQRIGDAAEMALIEFV